MRSILFFVTFIMLSTYADAQPQNKTAAQKFLHQLNQHCGKSFYGKIISGGKIGDGFTGETLIIRIDKCQNNAINIPFFVGENKSRTWLLTETNGILKLKHDHRHEDGSADKITMYGGTSTNEGLDSLQMFPADAATCKMIDYACANVWWFTINKTSLTYNLRRIGSERIFTVAFDLTQPFNYEQNAWGW